MYVLDRFQFLKIREYEPKPCFNNNIRGMRAGAVFGFCGEQFCQHPRVGEESVQRAEDIYGYDYGVGVRGSFGFCGDIGGVSIVCFMKRVIVNNVD